MDAYIELLKESYYKERKKLEGMWIFNQEGKLRFLAARKEMLDKAKENLSISQMLGRQDITEDIKENLLRDRNNAEKIEEYLKKAIEGEFSNIENDEKAELRNSQYSCDDYAEYVLQIEKVNALEAELENNRMFSDAVYEEQKAIAEGKNKTGGGE
ncbi:MAG: hypothetical protein PHT50_02720 [Candidatus Omnitrophica bacterium]|nr:hypothetical protein [Candidatus Omnitrophota bacterium]